MTRSTSEAVMGVYRERETAPYIDVCQDPQDAVYVSQRHSHKALLEGLLRYDRREDLLVTSNCDSR